MAGTVWALFQEGELSEEIRAALLGKLSPADRAQYGTFPSGGRAGARGRQFLLSRALLAFALEETLGTVPALAKTAAGQPYFPALPGCFLSLSHTEGAALLALSDAPVGVDIERVRPIPPRLGRDCAGRRLSGGAGRRRRPPPSGRAGARERSCPWGEEASRRDRRPGTLSCGPASPPPLPGRGSSRSGP